MGDWYSDSGMREIERDRGCKEPDYKINLARIGNNTAELIDGEIARAKAKHGEKPFNSTHEGFAVLKEEVDELWTEVKADASNERLRAEAVQVAAMAIRFINELTY